MSGVGRRTYLRDINPYLICPLCRGYLIDATTVVECLHSFCKSCILKHLTNEAYCPSCKLTLNQAKPDIKADKALQDIVYKLVPGLYHKEMRKRREFYKKHPEHADSTTPEQRGEDVSGRLIFSPEDAVSLSLEYLPPGVDPLAVLSNTIENIDTQQLSGKNSNNVNCTNNNNHHVNRHNNNLLNKNNTENESNNRANTRNRRYLQCPALVTIAHLKKFLGLKYNVDMTRYSIEICHRRAPFPEHWTLMDVAYIYAWNRNAPMRFFYRISQEEQRLEAPVHERPSTPGLGASLPPCDPESMENLSSPKNGKDMRETKQKLEKRSPSFAASTQNEKILGSQKEVSSESKSIKTPIKILKNPDGKYQVMKTPPYWNSASSLEKKLPSNAEKPNSEFSVVSIADGQNSNGVKITLKQRSSSTSPEVTSGKKPKVISDVLLRGGTLEKDGPGKFLFQPLLSKDGTGNAKLRKAAIGVEKQESKNCFAVKKAEGQLDGLEPNKKQFLQSFQLAAKANYSSEESSKKLPESSKPSSVDVYAFSSDPPINLLPGAVKRKTPPGLHLPLKRKKAVSAKERKPGVVAVKKPSGRGGVSIVPVSTSAPTSLTTTISSTSTPTSTVAVSEVSSSSHSPTKTSSSSSSSSSSNPGILPNLLDGCGLSIPASLSITLTAPKSPNLLDTMTNSDEGVAKSLTLEKVNPAITLNDKFVDPRVLKALKSGLIRMPPPPARLKGKANASGRKREQMMLPPSLNSILDLSGGAKRKIDLHPLRIPANVNVGNSSVPAVGVGVALATSSASVSSSSSSSSTSSLSSSKSLFATPTSSSSSKLPKLVHSSGNSNANGGTFGFKSPRDVLIPSPGGSQQVITLSDGQQYYRAPPGSLTPAAQRINDFPMPSSNRKPVYAPCLSSNSLSNSSNNSSNNNSNNSNSGGNSNSNGNNNRSNLSSVFPSLQSL